MKYVRPELDYVRFTNVDILTTSGDWETPMEPAEIGDEPKGF